MTTRFGGYAHARRRLAQKLWFASMAPALTYHLGEPLLRLLGRPRGGRPFDLAQVERVLVVRLDKIGDVVLTTSFLRELRRALPDARITLVVAPGSRAVVAECPYVDEVQTYDWRAARYLGPLHHAHTLAYAARRLTPHRFDLALVPCWGVDYYLASVLGYFSGARWRLGYSEHVTRDKARLNRGFDRFFTHVSHDSTVKHEVEHNMDLLRFAGAAVERDDLELWVSERDEASAAGLLRERGVQPGERLVALAPGAGAGKRQWPVDRFAALATWLRDHRDARIVVVGGRGEEALGAALAEAVGPRALDLVARTTLLQTAAVLRHCELFVGNDSGPMHLAAAVGARVVEVSCHPRGASALHENSPERFGPWAKEHAIVRPDAAIPPCSPDGCSAAAAHCITGVTLEAVQAAVAAQLPWRPAATSARSKII